MIEIPEKTIERMSMYRRILSDLLKAEKESVFSHELALRINGTPAQVRRDIMAIGYSGNPRKGYNVKELNKKIVELMDDPKGRKIALAGIGNLGRAILAYFMGRRPKLSITAAFDIDENKINRVIAGCRCYHIDQIEDVIKKEGITLGIITVPAAAAQNIVDKFVDSGITAVVNWAPVNLSVPRGVFLENRDITMSIEKAAYFAKNYKNIPLTDERERFT